MQNIEIISGYSIEELAECLADDFEYYLSRWDLPQPQYQMIKSYVECLLNEEDIIPFVKAEHRTIVQKIENFRKVVQINSNFTIQNRPKGYSNQIIKSSDKILIEVLKKAKPQFEMAINDYERERGWK